MNQLYYGDNLNVLREHIASESIDLIYLQPVKEAEVVKAQLPSPRLCR